VNNHEFEAVDGLSRGRDMAKTAKSILTSLIFVSVGLIILCMVEFWNEVMGDPWGSLFVLISFPIMGFPVLRMWWSKPSFAELFAVNNYTVVTTTYADGTKKVDNSDHNTQVLFKFILMVALLLVGGFVALVRIPILVIRFYVVRSKTPAEHRVSSIKLWLYFLLPVGAFIFAVFMLQVAGVLDLKVLFDEWVARGFRRPDENW
jgi:hypothetical protein